MIAEIRNGSRGRTVGPLKPAGKIRLDGESYDACSKGDWIGADTDIVVIGSRSSNLIVRPIHADDAATETLGEILSIGNATESTPLHAPPALIERCNAIAAGAVVGCILIPILCLLGTPLSPSAFLVPVAGAATGFLFRWFVKGALESVGPREDHRLRAYEIGAIVAGGAAMGAFVGVSAGFGFLGLSLGLVLGAIVGGGVSWIQLVLSAV